MKILPIKDLRNTNEISKTVKEENDPIFITKNGYADMVIMSQDVFDNIAKNKCDSKTISIKKDIYKNEFWFYRGVRCLKYIYVYLEETSIKIRDNNDIDKWTYIRNQEDADEFSELIVNFNSIYKEIYIINGFLLHKFHVFRKKICNHLTLMLKK